MTLNVLYYDIPLTLFDVAKNILKYDKLSEVHYKWCNDFETIRKNGIKRIVKLKPRGTYKTTIYDISFVIDYLMDDWVQNNGVFTKRILITSAIDDNAKNILKEIREHLNNNEELHHFFGVKSSNDLIASENQSEVRFKNRKVHKEPNIAAKGALSSIVSSHYDLIICDDITNDEDRESAAVREKKKRWYQDLISILEPDGEILVVGTRWHSDDLYQMLIEMNEKLPEESKYDIEIDTIVKSDGELNYPTIYTFEDVERLKIEKGLVEFYAQYMNEALPAETQRFKPENFHYYADYGTNYHDDPLQLHKCKHFAYVDPALGKENDYSVILVGAVKDRKLYIRDAFISNTTTPDAVIEQLDFFYNLYDFQQAGVEVNGFQSLFGSAVMSKGIPFKGINNVKKKEIRIDSLEPFINNGRVIFRDDWNKIYPELMDQLIRYPVHKHDDCPDCLEGLVRMSLKGGNFNVIDFRGFLSGVVRRGNE